MSDVNDMPDNAPPKPPRAPKSFANQVTMSQNSVTWLGQFGMPDAAFVEKYLIPVPNRSLPKEEREAIIAAAKEVAIGLKGKGEILAPVLQQVIDKRVNHGTDGTGDYPTYTQFYNRLRQVKKDLPEALQIVMPEITSEQIALVINAYDCWRVRVQMSTSERGPNR